MTSTPELSAFIKGNDKLSLSGQYMLHITVTHQETRSDSTSHSASHASMIWPGPWVLEHLTPDGWVLKVIEDVDDVDDEPSCMVGIDWTKRTLWERMRATSPWARKRVTILSSISIREALSLQRYRRWREI